MYVPTARRVCAMHGANFQNFFSVTLTGVLVRDTAAAWSLLVRVRLARQVGAPLGHIVLASLQSGMDLPLSHSGDWQ